MIEDCGFVYYGRHFRSADGSIPPAFGGLLQHYGSISVLTLPADNGTWGVGVVTSSKDAALRSMLEVDCWEKVVRAFPLVAHWIDAEPITDVKLMAKIEDRQRTYVVDGAPVATGMFCRLPMRGRAPTRHSGAGCRSASFTLPRCDRCFVRNRSTIAKGLAMRWSELTDRDRRAVLRRDACRSTVTASPRSKRTIEGRPYECDDADWVLGQALASSIMQGSGPASRLHRRGHAARSPGERARSTRASPSEAVALADSTPPPGPDRAELLSLVGA